MAEKRYDSKGRILRTGESQRSDGMYMYRYIDANRNRRSVYSWRLVDTDKNPSGRRSSESLRTIEQRIQKDLDDGINTDIAINTTVDNLCEKFFALNSELKESTRCNYMCLYNSHIKDELGNRKITSVRHSDIYKLYMDLSTIKNLKISTIKAINSILWQLFEIPTKDNELRTNPVNGVMVDVSKKLKEDRTKRHALTIREQSEFIDYIYSNKKYSKYGVLFTVLLGTGMRIGEALGLRWNDIDFKNNIIIVDHSLSYKGSVDGGYRYRVSAPKTAAGIRTIPMLDDVRSVLQKEKRRKKNHVETFEVDGYTGFVFINSSGKVYTPTFIFDTIQNIVADYNREEMARARVSGREPSPLPKISAHILRHTFCTRLCENESNLKVIQDVMGHKNISTTMNVYNEATMLEKQKNFRQLDGKIKLL